MDIQKFFRSTRAILILLQSSWRNSCTKRYKQSWFVTLSIARKFLKIENSAEQMRESNDPTVILYYAPPRPSSRLYDCKGRISRRYARDKSRESVMHSFSLGDELFKHENVKRFTSEG